MKKQRKKSNSTPSKRAYGTNLTSRTIINSSNNNVNNLNFSCTVNVEDIMVNKFNNVTIKSKNQAANNILNKFNCRVLLTDIRNRPNLVKPGDGCTLKMIQNACGNGDSIHAKRCGSKRCLFQNKFFPKNKAVSSVTFRQYDCIVPPGTTYINCHSSNVIYLITCSKCSLQYVGETVQKINERFGWHNTCLLYPDKYGYCRRLCEHFNEGSCKGADYWVQIVEKLEGNGRTERGSIDPSKTTERKKKETEWMLRLRTVYPYGLNDRIGDDYKNTEFQSQVASRFSSLPRLNSRVSRGKSHKGVSSLQPDQFLTKLKNYLTDDLSGTMNFIRVSLSSLKKSFLKEVHLLVSNFITDNSNKFIFHQWYYAIIDLIESKLYKEPTIKLKKSPPENICKVFFHNKGVELINLPSILHDDSLKQTLSSLPSTFEIPNVTYKLQEPISSKIFNFNSFVKNIDVQQFLEDDSVLPCNCSNSPYIDPHHKHIITGNLSIVKNNKLRKLFTKGPKFREPVSINWIKAKEHIMEGLKMCVTNWCVSKALDNRVFVPYLSKAEELVDNKIESLMVKTKIHKCRNVLGDPLVKNDLEELHQNFVVAPIDKATGNIAFICKRFYASVIVEELGLRDASSSSTYKNITNKTSREVIDKHLKFLADKFNMKDSTSDNSRLPNIYWLPKMHKDPIKFRFIIAAPECSIKPLSKTLVAIFKLFQWQIESYNLKCKFFSGVNTFWIIQNNSPVTETINRLNKRGRAKSIDTFDFSTLYTKIPHDKLLYVLNSLVDFCFEGGMSEYVAVTDYGARWVANPSSYKFVFSKANIKLAIRYLMSNCFFTFGSQVFQQIIGIPMGSDPAPFFANLFLYYYESKWLKKIQKTDIARARRLANTFRFIDDLAAINDGGEFSRSYQEIYPPELELGQENIENSSASFLDLDIRVQQGVFSISLYDKRDNFPFDIVRMPTASSNMPSTIFYSAIGAEILRVARASTGVEGFLVTSKAILNRMIKQGALVPKTRKVVTKTVNRHAASFNHLFSNNRDLIASLF